MKQKLLELLQQLLVKLMEAEHNQTENSKKLYLSAFLALGQNWCKNHDLGCAESVNNVFKRTFGRSIGGGTSTYLMYQALKDTNRFIKVQNPLPGDVVISPSGYGNKVIPSGHTGIVGEGEWIMSNDSSTGLFKQNFTHASWNARYKVKGNYPIHYFRVL